MRASPSLMRSPPGEIQGHPTESEPEQRIPLELLNFKTSTEVLLTGLLKEPPYGFIQATKDGNAREKPTSDSQ